VIVPSPCPSKIIPSPKASPRPFAVDANPRLGLEAAEGVATHFNCPVAASRAAGAPRLDDEYIVPPDTIGGLSTAPVWKPGLIGVLHARTSFFTLLRVIWVSVE
jgi:hypothetical protein